MTPDDARCSVPGCGDSAGAGLLCRTHYADALAGRPFADPGMCRVCGARTAAATDTYCPAHREVLRSREHAAMVPLELVEWFTHYPGCSAADGSLLKLFAQPDGATAGLACRVCQRLVALRGGRVAELARQELLAVGALVDAPPKRRRSAPTSAPDAPATVPTGRWSTACALCRRTVHLDRPPVGPIRCESCG
ncbi:hypothetical protein QI633_08135 [Nocardioides sp. QY071]|uniref:hypothetical protein n=1 Tax=Nocardioides sp. QY071 TaxID=3044187 RepID=UPI00249A9411|nr:hypothetical protein [Nocardioides sp. QY071]WGY03721.1 hypothetical protein QI633_08135 [Nocardioides sp. QY071]